MSTTSHRSRVERARKAWEKASKRFTDWCIANGYGNVRWSDLADAVAGVPAGAALYAAEREARAKLDAVESAAVQAGKAWRDGRGHVQLYAANDLRRWAAQNRRRLA